MKQVRYFSESETRILESLALFKYMTSSRFLKLGIVKHKSSLSAILRRLKEEKPSLIGDITFGFVPGVGKLEKVFYLTALGARFVEEHLSVSGRIIKYPSGKPFFNRDYKHRMAVIDFQIELYKWIAQNNIDIVSFKTYFDRITDSVGTKIDARGNGQLIADAEVHLKKGDVDIVFCLEVIRGTEPGKACKKLRMYFEAIELGVLCSKYKVNSQQYVICIFEDEKTMYSAMDKLMNWDNKAEVLRKHFYFGAYRDCLADFGRAWQTIGSEKGCFLGQNL